jgi:hypothetical protein
MLYTTFGTAKRGKAFNLENLTLKMLLPLFILKGFKEVFHKVTFPGPLILGLKPFFHMA